MSRRLIMILNDGGRANYLPGVEHDARNYLDFFHLPEGGLWEDNAIQTYHNDCTLTLLSAYILQERQREIEQHRELDYVVIVFCGHSYANAQGMTYFELSPGNEASLFQMKQAVKETRCLMIADSCRVIVLAEGGRIQDTRMFSRDSSDENYRSECFRLYNAAFRQLSKGYFTIGMAASLGQSAGEDDKGGYYTQELLSTAKTLIKVKKVSRRTDANYNPVAKFPLIHALTRDKFIKQGKNGQTPDIQAPQGMQAPFVVVAPI